MAESCARQVWVCKTNEVEDFPQDDNSQFLIGWDAYRFLLRLACGLDSPNRGETNVKGEIFRDWNRQKKRATHTRNLDTVFQQLKADSRVVGRCCLEQLQVAHRSIVARDLSCFRKGNRAIVAGHVNAYGSATNYVDRLLRVLNHSSRRASLVYITNPDDNVAQGILTKALIMRERGLIEYDVTSVSFAGLSRVIEDVDHLFCDLPMGEDFESDTFIMSVWANRVKRTNNFIHMRAGYGDKEALPTEWTKACLDRFISPEVISSETCDRTLRNERLFLTAEESIDVIVNMRMDGRSVSQSQFRFEAPHLVTA